MLLSRLGCTRPLLLAPSCGGRGRRELSILLAIIGTAWRPTVCATCEYETQGIEVPRETSSGTSGGIADAAATDNFTTLVDGKAVTNTITLNMTQHYYYENFNVTTMNQPERNRKLILMMEPCEGVVYLFVRKTRRCWPNPHTCCRPLPGATLQGRLLQGASAPPCNAARHTIDCDWTHFHSVIDGTRDAAPTFFEVPLNSAKYFLSVFAPREPNLKYGIRTPKFRLLAMADIGAYPRPGSQGRLRAKHVDAMSVELQWDKPVFTPAGISSLKNYHVYSSMLLATDQKQNEAVLLNPDKVMNSVCGLERNAVEYGLPLSDANCTAGFCSATVSGIIPKRRYLFNVVAVSHRRFSASYSGIIVLTDWEEETQLISDKVMSFLGAICGTVFGVVIIGYLWIAKLYA
eukprot:TRINITY_DN70427_c0_g1_i1.p1 TRINITY_DN70427_c0_g1~~TRINITY_DN70427_c0_g1_i1.p1  ORF type:complete len:404 (+),score=32.89 TRINITY_DN70427_c0_g1_i1:157-1368(+)